MSITYNALIQETTEDLQILHDNKYKLQVAKSVSTPGGSATYNVVYQSQELAATMSVSWGVQYGLNWTAKVPAPGAVVKYSGSWQACSLGQSFDLDSVGAWINNNNNPKADKACLNVGNNGYVMPVHIIIGVQDPDTKTWSPIYVHASKLIANAHGEWQPLEFVNIWYSEKIISATMVGDQATPTVTKDMSIPNNPWYFKYDVKKGEWQDQSKPFYESA